MKNITFKKLSIKNFLSIGDTPVEIDIKEGINFITGENLDVPGTKNGLGKSSVSDALNFAIFGDSLRNLKKDQMVNNITKNTTEVILEFNCNSPKGNNNFVITRTLNPSSLKVLKDGRDKTRDSIPNTTKYILEVLGANQDIFKNCIIMRANNTIPFLAQGKVEKKKFIESLFNLDIITKMFKSVKDDINISKRDYEIESKVKEQITNNIDSYKVKLKSEKSKIENTLQEYNRNIDKSNSEIEKLLQSEDHIDNFDETEKAYKADMKKASDAKIKISSDVKFEQQKLKEAKENKNKLNITGAICPYCKRPFDPNNIEHTKQEEKRLQDEIDKHSKSLAKLKKLKQLADNLYDDKEEALEKLRQRKSNIDNRDIKIKFYKDKILDNQNLIKSLENTSFSYLEELINNAEKELSEKDKVISEINNKLKKYEIARFILSEEGIRAFIIKKLLDLLNFRIRYYLSKQNSQYILSFNELFEEEILNKKNIPVSYGNLSGAEGKMIDLACIWAFRDILRLQASVNFNIAFYDEILDSSLDAKNSEIICNILNEFGSKEGQAIYLISHKADLTKAVTGEIINLQKKNGITTRKI